ncbi:hypothetical protein I316_06967 [Kwoniella heveanensis BCC8398]|uniref:Uncharacterized protein n=1 Tax=Kwoniella heveanensis BCC8398 TaxID=1296120 RepID=A0A1B9GJU0_9TREE|nr:hypothetical protein I316_06967 [Kwoniella heveanensis BCC8398]
MPHVLHRRACTYHDGDSSGKLYDSSGKVCETLSSQDKLFLAVALSLCGVVLLVLAGIYIRRFLKTRSRERANQLSAEPAMSSMRTPLVYHASASASLSRQGSHLPSSPLESSSSSFHQQAESPVSSPPSPGSPYSPNSETFHFPILSADGHLLPPPPASSRRSVEEHTLYDPYARPLPPAPSVAKPTLYAPVPKSTEKWSYHGGSEESDSYPIGLYSGAEIPYDGSIEYLREEEYGADGLSRIMASPTFSFVQQSFGNHEPQRVSYHRTPSTEGDEFLVYEYRSEEGYRRF